MNLLLIIILAAGAAYCLLMYFWYLGWQLVPESTAQVHVSGPAVPISVIIPARNEADRITACLASLVAQDYPPHLLELTVVDDHSEDRTAEVVKSFSTQGIRYVNLRDDLNGDTPASHKKAAIDCGIRHSAGELIVTTDADCTAGPGWLRELASLYELERPQMIIAPVRYTCDGSVLQRFQLIDFMSMQGITVAANRLGLGRMCNGANIAFSRVAFNKVGGYSGVDHLVSGDDYLLMMKIGQYPENRICTLKSRAAIVTTPPQPNWHAFLSQRIRWASKSGKYPDTKMTAILLLVYLFNLSIPLSLLLGFADSRFWWAGFALLVSKIVSEYLFLRPVARFFGVTGYIGYFVCLQPLHIFYIIIAGFLGFAGDFEWKGRKAKQPIRNKTD